MDGPRLPADAAHLWGWFCELAGARGSNGYGPNPIGYQDILAWATLTGTAPYPAEVSVILELDRLYLSETATTAKE